MKTELSTYDNSWYRPGSAFKRFFWHYINTIVFKSGIFPFYGLKIFLLKAFGAKVGQGVIIKPFVNIKYPWFLSIGNHVWIGENVWIDNLADVTIGNNACLSQGALLLTGNHNYTKPAFDLSINSIILEDGVWIGAKAIVCPGVICKSHSVLMIGSIATGDLQPYSIYTGNPAEKIKSRVIQE